MKEELAFVGMVAAKGSYLLGNITRARKNAVHIFPFPGTALKELLILSKKYPNGNRGGFGIG